MIQAMGKTSKQRELATTQKLPDPAWAAAVQKPTGLAAKLTSLGALLFERYPGIPLATTVQERVNAHRIYFAWDGVNILMVKRTDLPRPTDAEVERALLALAEDASVVA